jgi:sugar O-acyltransferase (sialic acid O-acetyltransferase NeuD family)
VLAYEEVGQLSRVVVLGAGGHAKVVLPTIEGSGRHEIIGLLDDDGIRHGADVYDYRVLGDRALLVELRSRGVSACVAAVGDNAARAEISRLLRAHSFELVPATHPAATVLRGSEIGDGTVVLPGAFIGADTRVGEGVIISVGVVVGHDVVVGDYAQLCLHVNLSGGAVVGSHAFVGTGATLLPQTRIGSGVTVGAHAVVNRDLPDGVVAAGVPVRIIERRQGASPC